MRYTLLLAAFLGTKSLLSQTEPTFEQVLAKHRAAYGADSADAATGILSSAIVFQIYNGVTTRFTTKSASNKAGYFYEVIDFGSSKRVYWITPTDAYGGEGDSTIREVVLLPRNQTVKELGAAYGSYAILSEESLTRLSGVIFEPSANFQGAEYFKVSATMSDSIYYGYKMSIYINKSTYLIDHYTVSSDNLENPDVATVVSFSDYRSVDGWMRPYKEKLKSLLDGLTVEVFYKIQTTKFDQAILYPPLSGH